MEMLYEELKIVHKGIGNAVWESRRVYAELGMVCVKSGIVYGNMDAWELGMVYGKSRISYGNRDAWELGMVHGKSGIVFGYRDE